MKALIFLKKKKNGDKFPEMKNKTEWWKFYYLAIHLTDHNSRTITANLMRITESDLNEMKNCRRLEACVTTVSPKSTIFTKG